MGISLLFDFATVLTFIIVSILFVFSILSFGKLIRPHHPNELKNSIYECGEPPIGSAWLNYNMRFYVIGLIFIVFDVEIVFIYPVGVVFRSWIKSGNGMTALMEILIFIIILLLALVYVWVKGDLEWVKDHIKGGKEPIKSFKKELTPERMDYRRKNND